MKSKSIVTALGLLVLGDGNTIVGGLSLADDSSNTKNMIFNHHPHPTLTTCIDQPVFKHIIDDDDDNDAQDVSSLHHDNMMLSKVVLNADNGVCDIAMDNDGLAVIMAYHPTSKYVGQDKCVYEMCIAAEEESGAMDAEQCRHVAIAIHVEDCSLSSPSLITVLRDSKEVRYDIFVV